MEIDALSERIRVALLEEASPPLCAWLFGSRARGDSRSDGDVDVAVLLGCELPGTLAGGALPIEGRLEAELSMPVDLVVVDTSPVDLVHRVLRDGRLLYDHDPSARVRFETRARREYFDLLPYLREYRRLPARVATR